MTDRRGSSLYADRSHIGLHAPCSLPVQLILELLGDAWVGVQRGQNKEARETVAPTPVSILTK